MAGRLIKSGFLLKNFNKTGKRCTEYCLILLKKQRNHGNIIRTIAVSALSFACRKKTAGRFWSLPPGSIRHCFKTIEWKKN
jgi:hypothetical protein